MKGTLLLLLALLFVNITLSQSSRKNYSIQQLESILKEDTSSSTTKNEVLKLLVTRDIPDTNRVKYYTSLANNTRKTKEFSLGIKYCDSALFFVPSKDLKEQEKVKKVLIKIYTSKGESDKSLKIYLEMLSAYEDAGDVQNSAQMNNTIGVFFKRMQEMDNALYHLKESVDQAEKIGDDKILASSLMTLGNVLKFKEEFEEAENIYARSIEICEREDFKRLLAGNYNNMGSLSRLMEKPKEAMQYYRKAVEINKEMKNEKWLSYNYNNMGTLYKNEGNYAEALRLYKLSIETKERIGDDRGRMQTILSVAETYEEMRDFSKAYRYSEEYRELNDSLLKADNLESVKSLAAEFQAEKREAEIAQLSIQGELDQERIKVSEQRMWLLGFGAFILLVLVLYVWRSSLSRKQSNIELAEKNNEIHAKNEELDAKNQEITDSINYAKRFQTSILASEKELNQQFKAHAVLYKPKDIVSGDFYMLEPLSSGGSVLVVADCTGHGVPGAMVSLIGASYISRAIHEEHIDDPGKALSFLNQNMPKAFESDQVTINDGMDLSICHVSEDRNYLSFAGANRNCWILNRSEQFFERKGRKELDQYTEANGIGLLELKGTRSGIGKTSSSTKFEGVQVSIQKGDRLILTTDGYVDQFGGEDGKKFKKSQLRNVLMSNYEVPADQLRNLLNESILNWMKEEEQVDDICVMIIDF